MGGGDFWTVVQQPYEFGYQSITLMTKSLHGDQTVIPGTKKIYVPTLIVQKNNVEEFSQKLNQLRRRS